MKKIKLTQNKFALIDDEDYSIVFLFKWCAHKLRNSFYAETSVYFKENQRILISMHRLILNLKSGEQADHKDGNGLNNQKSNIRKCTPQQNGMNRGKYKNTSSKFKGVGWHKRDRRWRAKITLNGKSIQIGSFKNEIEAAKVYDKFANKYYGDFARLNF